MMIPDPQFPQHSPPHGAQVTKPDFFLWMNSFLGATKSFLKMYLLFSKPPHITQFTQHANRTEYQTRVFFFFPKFTTSRQISVYIQVERRDALCLGIPRAGRVQSVLVIRLDSLTKFTLIWLTITTMSSQIILTKYLGYSREVTGNVCPRTNTYADVTENKYKAYKLSNILPPLK